MDGTVVHRKLRFGPFELSIGERVLRRDGRVLPLGDRALDILTYLADRPGEVIAKRELMDHVWSDVTVEEGSLRVHVAVIRKALGDGQFGNRYMQTSRDGAIRSSAPSSDLKMARAAGAIIPISEEDSLRNPQC
jgi:DNA-binding winged helix-turn-helix (wHTH) protein